MKTETTTDQMPRETAMALLTSGQRMTASFRRTCLRATERIVEPVSRSTRMNVSAPATPMQKFERKLRNANAKQLTTWARRATRKGEKLQDLLFESQIAVDSKPTLEMLERSIAEIDTISQAIKSELDNRSTRGKLKHV